MQAPNATTRPKHSLLETQNHGKYSSQLAPGFPGRVIESPCMPKNGSRIAIRRRLFNVIRYLLVTVIAVPILERLVRVTIRESGRSHLLDGGRLRWTESRLGVVTVHGRYYNTSSRIAVYLAGAFMLAGLTLIELEQTLLQLKLLRMRKYAPNLTSTCGIEISRETTAVCGTISETTSDVKAQQSRRHYPFPRTRFKKRELEMPAC